MATGDLGHFLEEVESFAGNEYLHALALGSELPEAQREAIANKLHDYTGLAVSYILKANLRIDGGEFAKTLQDATDTTTTPHKKAVTQN